MFEKQKQNTKCKTLAIEVTIAKDTFYALFLYSMFQKFLKILMFM